MTVHPKLSLRAVPSGKPYDDTSIGVLASSPPSAHSIYLEPHTFDLEALASFGDSPTAVLAPLEQVTLFRKRFAMGPSVLAQGLARAGAPYYIPTGSEPDKARGLIRLGLRIRGTRTELLDALRRAEVPTEVLDVRAGDALVFLTDRSAPELERAQLAP